MRRGLMVLLGAGVIFGYGSAIARAAHHRHGCDRWGDTEARGWQRSRWDTPPTTFGAPTPASVAPVVLSPPSAPAPVVVNSATAPAPAAPPVVVSPAAAPAAAPLVIVIPVNANAQPTVSAASGVPVPSTSSAAGPQ